MRRSNIQANKQKGENLKQLDEDRNSNKRMEKRNTDGEAEKSGRTKQMKREIENKRLKKTNYENERMDDQRP